MEQRHKDDSAAHATAQSPTFVARQQPTRDPDISTRLNVPGASQHTTTTEANGAALSQSFARDDSVAEPMRDAVDVSPRARQEGSPPAKEQGATEAAATLERLRAQNRRHQANHRSRVKVLLSTYPYPFSAPLHYYTSGLQLKFPAYCV